MIAGDKIKCRTSVGYYTLTEGKVYECLYGLEEGIFFRPSICHCDWGQR